MRARGFYFARKIALVMQCQILDWRKPLLKMKRLAIFLVLLSLFTLVSGCQPQFQPGTYTDDMGRAVSLKEVPRRIVSGVPSITEILFALGVQENVVGVSDYSDYPEEAKSKPSIGSYFKPSVEKIVDLKPDLVLTNGSSKPLMTQLDSLGINYLVINPKDIPAILKDIELLGKVTGTESRAKTVVKDMQARINRVTARVKDAPRVRTFYTFATTDLNNPWTAGPGSFINSLITIAGGENIAANLQAPYAQISIEVVVSADPAIIITDASMGSAVTAVTGIRQNPLWNQMAALKQNRLYTIDGNLVNRSGPRIVQGLEEVAKIIHPELFK